MVGYTFDEEKHVHTLDGKRLHGVTTCLSIWGDSQGLIDWAVKTAVQAMVEGKTPEEAVVAHTKKRDKAGDLGTAVHKELEDALNTWIEEGEVAYTENDVVNRVLNWMLDEGIKPLKSEMHVYSRTHFYGGIADGVIEKDGKKFILDFKTSGTIQPKAFLQCAAYSVAVKEMKPDAEVAGVVIVHIPRGKSFDPTKNVYWRHDIKDIEEGWLNVFKSYLLYKKLKDILYTT